MMITDDGKKKAFHVTGPNGAPPEGSSMMPPPPYHINQMHHPNASYRGMNGPPMGMFPGDGYPPIGADGGGGGGGGYHPPDGLVPSSNGGVSGGGGSGGSLHPPDPGSGRGGGMYRGGGNEGGAGGVYYHPSMHMGPPPPGTPTDAYMTAGGYYIAGPGGYYAPLPGTYSGRGGGRVPMQQSFPGGRNWIGARPPPPGQPGISSGLQIVVHNLPWDCTAELLKESFGPCGEIDRADVVFDSRGRSRGFGVVRFATASQAEEAVEKMNNTHIGGRLVSVRVDRFA
jgi:hypothetical protein